MTCELNADEVYDLQHKLLQVLQDEEASLAVGIAALIETLSTAANYAETPEGIVETLVAQRMKRVYLEREETRQ
jgi:hypothetical protein